MKLLFIGDGQLGQMLGRSAIQHGHEVLLYSTREHTIKPLSAQLNLPLSLAEAIRWSDCVSWEHEDIPAEVLTAAQAKFLFDTNRIKGLTDRRTEKQLFDEQQVATSPWSAFSTPAELTEILAHSDAAQVIKAARGGYDGKGQWRFQPGDALEPLAQTAGQQAGIVEAMIPFKREVSLVGARGQDGQIACYPLVINVHRQGILSHTFAGLAEPDAQLQQQAEQAFAKITTALDYVGVLGIEFFVVEEAGNQHLLVNEIAPRVHNSGHWSMQGSSHSQFDLHIRALTQMPLGQPTIRPTLMLNVIGVAEIPSALWQDARCQCHWYNKAARPGRKVGHVNIQVDSLEEAEQWVTEWSPRLQTLAD